MKKHLFKFPLYLLLAVVAVFMSVWVFALVRCDVLTIAYYKDFEYAYQNNTMLGDMEYFKILSCDGSSAEVYYVSEGMTGGNVLTFRKQQGSWVETGWNTVWSSSGSASDVIWPYWWHFIYGGF